MAIVHTALLLAVHRRRDPRRVEALVSRAAVSLHLAAVLGVTVAPLQAQAGLPWRRADSVATIDGHRLELRAVPWRDFMPSPVRRGGSDLMVNLILTSADTLPFPTGLRVDSAWVRSGDQVWATTPTAEPRPDAPRGLDLMLRGGPRWETGTPIEVLIRIRPRSGRAGYLLVRGVPIGRTS